MAQSTITSSDIQMSAAQLTVGGTDIGGTDGGVKFTPKGTFKTVFVDQSSMAQRHFITQEEASVTANLTEYNLTKMALGMAGETYTLDSGGVKKKIEVGGGQITLASDYVELVITPLIDGSQTLSTNNNLKITIYKCIPVKHPELSFTKDGVRFIPVQFDAIADTTKAAGKQLYLLGDSTATA
ncbi:MAG: hypothetical protein Q7J73_00690 [Dehalococcoidales bacterium]|nr:hypothetical protein [Dehalococcoidales bacterium]